MGTLECLTVIKREWNRSRTWIFLEDALMKEKWPSFMHWSVSIKICANDNHHQNEQCSESGHNFQPNASECGKITNRLMVFFGIIQNPLIANMSATTECFWERWMNEEKSMRIDEKVEYKATSYNYGRNCQCRGYTYAWPLIICFALDKSLN